MIGNAAQFDGIDDAYSLGYVPEVSAIESDFFVGAWIRPDRLVGRQAIVGHSQVVDQKGFSFGLEGASPVLDFHGVQEIVASDIQIAADTWTFVLANVVASGTDGNAIEVFFLSMGPG